MPDTNLYHENFWTTGEKEKEEERRGSGASVKNAFRSSWSTSHGIYMHLRSVRTHVPLCHFTFSLSVSVSMYVIDRESKHHDTARQKCHNANCQQHSRSIHFAFTHPAKLGTNMLCYTKDWKDPISFFRVPDWLISNHPISAILIYPVHYLLPPTAVG